MGMTPYPGGNDNYENPSILVSDDGNTWAVPAGLTNPIDAEPAPGHNADADIIVAQDDVMYCHYIDWQANHVVTVKRRSSADGITWSAEADALVENYLASPSVIWDGAQYVMYYINYETSPFVLKKRTAATITGEWSAAAECTLAMPTGRQIWHIDVYLDGSLYRAVVATSDTGTTVQNTNLYESWSADGATWTLGSNTLIAPNSAAFRNKNIYRSTLWPNGTQFDIWYSAENTGAAWSVGKVTKTLTTP
jgi:hypothetical protein